MSSDLSPDGEQFLRDAVQGGFFPDRGQALDEAVRLLKGRIELLQHIDEGIRQLRSGEYTDYDEDELSGFFEELKGEARKQFERGLSIVGFGFSP